VANHSLKSDAPSSDDSEKQGETLPPPPFLRARPKHFFSNDFELEIVEDYSKAEAETERKTSPKWLSVLMELNLLLLILVVGVPVLLYCIWSSGT
jgi:hypothetical protein